MKYYFFSGFITCIFLISCKPNSADRKISRQNFNEVDTVQQENEPSSVDTNTIHKTFESDTLLNLLMEDTVDCGRIINMIFHRSLYKFPVENTYKKEELTAIFESVKDSVLMIKVMLIDSTADYRQTVDWLKLNCKNRILEQTPLYGPDPKPVLVKYDTRLLEILMKKCALE